MSLYYSFSTVFSFSVILLEIEWKLKTSSGIKYLTANTEVWPVTIVEQIVYECIFLATELILYRNKLASCLMYLWAFCCAPRICILFFNVVLLFQIYVTSLYRPNIPLRLI